MNRIEQLLGDQLKKARLKKGLTQEQLAELSGLHRTYIGSVERGERNITVKNLYIFYASNDGCISSLCAFQLRVEKVQ